MRFLHRAAVVCAFLAGMYLAPACMHAQTGAAAPQFLIFADTAGVSRVAPDTYLTWVFARASENAPPSSGVLVAFDCAKGEVKRLAHVVYQLNGDSTGVTGAVVEDTTGWVAVSNPRLFTLVCKVGAAHGDDGDAQTAPAETPKSPAPTWSVS